MFGWQDATASKDALVKRSKHIGVQRANNVYPKGLARGDCSQRPPGKEIQIHRGLKGQQGVSQGFGKRRLHPKTSGKEVQIPKGKRQANAMAKAMAEAKAMANGKDQRPTGKSNRRRQDTQGKEDMQREWQKQRQGRNAKANAMAKAETNSIGKRRKAKGRGQRQKAKARARCKRQRQKQRTTAKR